MTRVTLEAGTVLYHGVQQNVFDQNDLYPPGEISLPAWFSRDVQVARRFARRGPVRAYRLEEAVSLQVISSSAEFRALLNEYDLGDGTPEEIVEGLPGEFFGWIVPDNYGPGSDDLLLGVQTQLEFEREI